ncbi:hypothetical protein [Rhodococcus sp. 114MFTsu3.1]|uniref:hypothetical protein n=1 Tax=Rhodococcus sp. 114MFTsu3.1 TaxID=1172184 RepID=UPI000375C917|nr:hypothetical protein [Rhodococcus sp. 114MFTsu3.1]
MLPSEGPGLLPDDNQPSLTGLQQAIDNATPWDMEPALDAIRFLAQTRKDFEAYDLTESCGIEFDHPARWGAVFSKAQDQGLIVCVGYGRSRRPTRSGGLTRFWRGVDAA